MSDSVRLGQDSQHALERLLPHLAECFAAQTEAEAWATFTQRLQAYFPRLFRLLIALYGHRSDFFYHLEKILAAAAYAWVARPTDLRALDVAREADPSWFQSNHMLGGVCYVDLLAGNLRGVGEKIPYFKELGLTYLHLMPLFKCPEGNSDGGYAVSSYREVNPALGTVDELRDLAADLRRNGISLVLDFIFNHTSDEHVWARRARAGDEDFRDYYFIFPDRSLPDQYESTLREIFPDEHRGVFSPVAPLPAHPLGRVGESGGAVDRRGDGWVWTTFHTFQWDLNYGNPAVFTAMAEEMLFLANLGVEVLRLDAIAFIWKQLGTNCENLPEAHLLVQAFNALCRIAAPALLFKSEAIVHPDDVAKYISPDECQLSYNPLLMALLWNSLATRKVRLLTHAMRTRFAIAPQCAWVNYVRSHDDIGWTFSDEDAAWLGVKGTDHRQFLNAFYTGRFPGSFARGLPFQENPQTGDCRISGTCASLAGLEKALAEGNTAEVELALKRILLLYSVIFSIGGVPLIYLGDEWGVLNDYGYRDIPANADDSRWTHRPAMDWAKAARRVEPTTVEGRLYQKLRRLIELRQQQPAFAGGEMIVVNTENVHVFGYVRRGGGERMLVIANFSEQMQVLAASVCLGWGGAFTDLVSAAPAHMKQGLQLEPYQFLWLKPG